MPVSYQWGVLVPAGNQYGICISVLLLKPCYWVADCAVNRIQRMVPTILHASWSASSSTLSFALQATTTRSAGIGAEATAAILL